MKHVHPIISSTHLAQSVLFFSPSLGNACYRASSLWCIPVDFLHPSLHGQHQTVTYVTVFHTYSVPCMHMVFLSTQVTLHELIVYLFEPSNSAVTSMMLRKAAKTLKHHIWCRSEQLLIVSHTYMSCWISNLAVGRRALNMKGSKLVFALK